jgi:hypothetical protein
MPCTDSWADGDAKSGSPRVSRQQLGLLNVGFLVAVRLRRRLFRALARAFRSSYVVGVLIGFLHGELKVKQFGVSPQAFLQMPSRQK